MRPAPTPALPAQTVLKQALGVSVHALISLATDDRLRCSSARADTEPTMR